MTLIRNANAKISTKITRFIPLPFLRAFFGLILALGAPSGWILVQWLAGRDPFSTEHIDSLLYTYITLTTIIVFSALGYFIGRREQIITALALTDGLTALYNKRYFKNRLEQEFERHQRNATPLAIILIDLDFFKHVNDHYGHQAGDECLIKVAHSIDKAIYRPADLVARYGGEEFVILLPETEGLQAFVVANRVNEAVSDLGLDHEYAEGHKKVSISVGVSSAIPTEESSAKKLLEAADGALYKAKENGRNRVEMQMD